MGDGRTRRKAPPERQQRDDATDGTHAGQFDLFGAAPDDARVVPPAAGAHAEAGTGERRPAPDGNGDAPLAADLHANDGAGATSAAQDESGDSPPAVDLHANDSTDVTPATPDERGDTPAAASPPPHPRDEASPPSTGMLWDEPAPPPTPNKAKRRRGVPPAPISPEVADAAAGLPPTVRLGTSSWYFPGWDGIVYDGDFAQTKLSREGLEAYGAHPLLKSVSLDRSFYGPVSVAAYLRYAQQVPDDFRFVVKAPASVTDAVVRGRRGEPAGPNPTFLDARLATDEFVRPCLDGLGRKAGVLVFQFSPLPDHLLAEPAGLIDRLSAFFAALPPLPPDAGGPRYAIEIRDASLLTPRSAYATASACTRACPIRCARPPRSRCSTATRRGR